jgi:hypothetical protein
MFFHHLGEYQDVVNECHDESGEKVAWLGHWSGGLATCSGEMVAACWVEVVAVEASASGSSDVGLESSAATSETESGVLVLALAAGSSGVA